MSTNDDTELAQPPGGERRRELWLQHAAGYILFRDARRYAIDRLDPDLDESARAAALRAIDDALYGLMMIADGVTGGLSNGELTVSVRLVARLERTEPDGTITLAHELDLGPPDGDGMCMGYHGWREGDFGDDPILRVVRRE
ncbi:MAG: hypothetical protein M5U28_29790 [Sandaracinaceae bacterium]|nr:hypothetical protein [Sandaracinaceae bacterium]